MSRQSSAPLSAMKVRSRTPVRRIAEPLQSFVRWESIASLLLVGATVAALSLANSPWAEGFEALWHIELGFELGDFTVREDLRHWINDGLMAIFFLLVGLEIKREVLVGELASMREATLPIAAAVGGMAVPALFYLAVTGSLGASAPEGWGVPVATDIAFALGALTLLRGRVPTGLIVFLVALAIVDDIGAVLVIALFYTEGLALGWLGIAAVFLGLLALISGLGIRHPLPYWLLGIGLWFGVLESGIHATVAGILLAFTIPAHRRVDGDYFLRRARELLDIFEAASDPAITDEASIGQQEAVRVLEMGCEQVQTPLQRIERGLSPWVSYLILPIFALANAGVPLEGAVSQGMQPVALGIGAGLVLGKPIGILLASWLAVRAGIADLPAGVSWRHVTGAVMLAGIGFTMSLFIAGLAFEGSELLQVAKLGILAASLISGVLGYLWLRALPKPNAVLRAPAPEAASP